MFGRVLRGHDDVGNRSRSHYPQRHDLIDAGVGSIELRDDFVAQNVTLDVPSQVILYTLPLNIHASISIERAWVRQAGVRKNKSATTRARSS